MNWSYTSCDTLERSKKNPQDSAGGPSFMLCNVKFAQTEKRTVFWICHCEASVRNVVVTNLYFADDCNRCTITFVLSDGSRSTTREYESLGLKDEVQVFKELHNETIQPFYMFGGCLYVVESFSYLGGRSNNNDWFPQESIQCTGLLIVLGTRSTRAYGVARTWDGWGIDLQNACLIQNHPKQLWDIIRLINTLECQCFLKVIDISVSICIKSTITLNRR